MKKRAFSTIFLLATLISNAAPIYRYVKTTASGRADGTSWENASANIQTMIDGVNANAEKGEVRVGAGTYLIAATLTLPDGVNISGGYPANATTASQTRDLKANLTVFDGQNSRRILTGPTNADVISKVTTINGLIFQRGNSDHGSAVWLSFGTVLQNCILRNNAGYTDYGAALYVTPNPAITAAANIGGAIINCLFINNSSYSAKGGAGGMFVEPACYLTILNCVFANNLCNDVTGAGGLNYSAPSAMVQNNIFYNNKGANADAKYNNINSGKSTTKGNCNNWYDNDALPMSFYVDASHPIGATYNNKCRTDFATPNFVMPTTFIGYDNTKMAQIAASDWSLKSTSGCIDIGAVSSIGNPFTNMDTKVAHSYIYTDMIGVVRIDKTAPDLGCYEYRNPLSAAQLADIETVYQRLKNETLNSTVTEANITTYIGSTWDNTVGNWTDISYNIVAPNPSNIGEHLGRILQLARAYSKSGTYYQSAAVMNVINKAFAYFLTNNISISANSGSYAYSLANPLTITSVLSIVGDAMDQTVKGSLVDYINNMQILGGYYTGINLAWMSNWRIRQGCMNKDYEQIHRTIANVSTLLDMTSSDQLPSGGKADGLKVDYAYFQHYMMYNGEYSARIPGAMISYPGYIAGTSFDKAFPIQTLGDYVLEAQYWLSFRTFGDISTRGRRLAKGSINYPLCYNSFFDGMKLADPARAAQYEEYKNEQINNGPFTKAGNKHFFTSDLMVHRGTADYMSVKIPSSRNMLTEIQNLENLKGSNLSYGLTQILTNSNEFTDISPVWDWTRLPGTTTPMGTLFMPPNNADWRVPGTNPYAGGVSDGKNGVMVFTSTYQGVTSTKGYFMLGNAMVCIGSGITSTNTSGIVTSVNQSLSYGTVTLKNNGTQSTFTATQSTYYNTLNWVHHYNVGYYFPPQTAKIVMKNDNQSGSWYDVNRTTTSSTIVPSKMFSIWFDHGVQPTDAAPASYQYIVVPSVSATAFASWVTTNPYTVVSNTKDIQCVKNSTLDMYGIVFYTAGTITLDNGLSVKSDKAAVVILSGKVVAGSTMKVSVGDPMYIANNVITLEIKKLNGGTSAGKVLTVAMPTGNYLGSTATSEFAFNEILSVNDHFANLVKIYPNPSADTFMLTFDENISTMKVTDLSGKTIEVIEKDYLIGTKIQVGKKWKPGCYMLTLINEVGKKESIKLIKE